MAGYDVSKVRVHPVKLQGIGVPAQFMGRYFQSPILKTLDKSEMAHSLKTIVFILLDKKFIDTAKHHKFYVL